MLTYLTIKTWCLQVSFFEIYQEKIRDLLAVDKALQGPTIALARSLTPVSTTDSSGNVSEHGDEVNQESLSSHSWSPGEEASVSSKGNQGSYLHGDSMSQKGRKRLKQWRHYPSQLNESTEDQAYLKVREHPVIGPYVEGLIWKDVETWKDINKLIELGAANRTTHTTDANLHSSRSHALFTIRLIKVHLLFCHKMFERWHKDLSQWKQQST